VAFVEAKLKGDLAGDLSRFEKRVSEGVLFKGVAATARVVYDEAKTLCPVSDQSHFFYGSNSKKSGQRYFFASGNLRNSIYRVYSPERSDAARKTYRISWNHVKAPYGFMVEFGTKNAAAHPFMRPAFGRINDAIAAGKDAMRASLAGGA
jgi:HK97 gp10 family phage protein